VGVEFDDLFDGSWPGQRRPNRRCSATTREVARSLHTTTDAIRYVLDQHPAPPGSI
jgi:hypothetical protein